MITCPKCTNKQTNHEECEACGLLFHKYERSQTRKKKKEAAKIVAKPKNLLWPLLATAFVLVTLSASLTYYFVDGIHKPNMRNKVAAPAIEAPDDRQTESPLKASETREQQQGIENSQLTLTLRPLDYAKNATVAIETPWGKGAGFFINENSIITNKHVVSPDQGHLAEIKHNVETRRKLITLEQEKMAVLRHKMKKIENGPSRQQLAIIIKEREKELAKMLPAQKASEAKLKSLNKIFSYTDIKIFLFDGNEYTAQHLEISPERDLALLTVYAGNTTALRPAKKNRPMQQGDKVYTIGNPVGLRNTVTSGIFSGYRRHGETNDVYLQTDAPINPGNSGGPLIDEHGFVHGVNTMIIKGTQGIGFAIPIQTVLDEFYLGPILEQQ